MGIGVFKIGCDSDVVKTATFEGRYMTPMDNEDTYYHTINANKTNVAVLFDVPVIVYRIAKNETTRNIFDNECPDI